MNGHVQHFGEAQDRAPLPSHLVGASWRVESHRHRMSTMDRIVITAATIIKRYSNRVSRDREAAILRYFHSTPLAPLVPILFGTSERNDSQESERYELLMSLIPGKPLSRESLNPTLIRNLASAMATCHRLTSFTSYGTVTPYIAVEQPARPCFGSFLLQQLATWRARLPATALKYRMVSEVLAREVNRAMSRWNEFTPPVLSHNDFGLSNILHANDNITGIVDWEYAGAYPLAWELRKLFPVLHWTSSELAAEFDATYCALCPSAVMPTLGEQAVLVASDCIGAFSHRGRAAQQSKEEIDRRLERALTILNW